MPADPHAFIAEYKDREVDGKSRESVRANIAALIEQVRDGTQYRVRLLLDENHHQFINLVSAAVRSIRSWLTG
jgi:staphylococcal nuclease domain-containing protein 1